MREQVRHRANFACEYCGLTEADMAGELTIDHFYPQVLGGDDTLANLVYCCVRCNQYKADYWPQLLGSPVLWNPRLEPAQIHWLELADGILYPLTATGKFTIQRLQLNRPLLIAYRLRRRQQEEAQRGLSRFKALLELVDQLEQQHASLLEEHHTLLQEVKRLLRLLLSR